VSCAWTRSCQETADGADRRGRSYSTASRRAGIMPDARVEAAFAQCFWWQDLRSPATRQISRRLCRAPSCHAGASTAAPPDISLCPRLRRYAPSHGPVSRGRGAGRQPSLTKGHASPPAMALSIQRSAFALCQRHSRADAAAHPTNPTHPCSYKSGWTWIPR
jgi:hypothetical protein